MKPEQTARQGRLRLGPLWALPGGCAVSLFVLSAMVAGQVYSLERATVDGGGIMHSTGGSFDLSGTIGQPDAGAHSGGSFELTGGFWIATSPTDCNEDGVVGLSDVADFSVCILGPAFPAIPGCECFDADGNGRVDVADFAVLQIQFDDS